MRSQLPILGTTFNDGSKLIRIVINESGAEYQDHSRYYYS